MLKCHVNAEEAPLTNLPVPFSSFRPVFFFCNKPNTISFCLQQTLGSTLNSLTLWTTHRGVFCPYGEVPIEQVQHNSSWSAMPDTVIMCFVSLIPTIPTVAWEENRLPWKDVPILKALLFWSHGRFNWCSRFDISLGKCIMIL